MSTTTRLPGIIQKAAPAATTAPASTDPNADAISAMLDKLDTIRSRQGPAAERQAIQAATATLQQFSQQDTKAAPTRAAGPLRHTLGDLEIAKKTQSGAGFWDSLFGQVQAEHRFGAPPLADQ